MPHARRIVVALGLGVSTVGLVLGSAEARSVARHMEIDGSRMELSMPFRMLDRPLGGTRPAPVPAGDVGITGSSIAAVPGGALIVDGDSGKLLRTDTQGTAIAELAIGRDASQLVVDAKRERAYVVDREHDRIVVASLRDGGLAELQAFRTAAEPFGIAMTPDRKTLLVSHVADQRLLAIDTSSGAVGWDLPLGPEPRGVAISPDGREALVTFLTTGAVARIDLRGKPSVSFVSLDPPSPNHGRSPQMEFAQAVPQAAVAGIALPDRGKGFARNAFAAAYVGHGIAVVPHQVSTPQLASEDFQPRFEGYGGGNGFTPPVVHRLVFLDRAGDEGRTAVATTALHQPRALAYDAARDALYVAGYGSDEIIALAGASQSSVHLGWQLPLSSPGGCGPDGLAVDERTGDLMVFCSLSRTMVRVEGKLDAPTPPKVVAMGPELAKSRHSALELHGKELFRRGRSEVLSNAGAMACASCHAEARTDGLTWSLQGNILQTPLLLGRLEGTHPFKWDGQDSTLLVSLTNTVKRLGGRGISSRDAEALKAYLTSLPAPRVPAVGDAQAVARGEQLFGTAGCAGCHGGPMTTDRERHDLASDLSAVDTPSLTGLAHSAPYYHDGSATTLEAVLRNNGSIHAMGRTQSLADEEIVDLVAYLETL